MPFVPETLPSIEVWNRLNEADSYLAVVFDEYGGTSGLITREDLIEELFGELQDEFDHERALVTPMGEGRLVVRGDMLVSYLEEMINVDLPHGTSHTVGGLVLDALGRIPAVGDQVEISGLTMRVEAVVGNSVNSVCIILDDEAAEGDEEAL
jgi:CBS domain containing-hemolysin-like protein